MSMAVISFAINFSQKQIASASSSDFRQIQTGLEDSADDDDEDDN